MCKVTATEILATPGGATNIHATDIILSEYFSTLRTISFYPARLKLCAPERFAK